ncbi:MAG: DegT/DnrJ/EryC1/StrS family aminotransferase [Trueperaceae bacterium]|nr:MAG: DegT/DnrJ/EryC1/StrS family aminotransferase [Trueperaceae bacterium]
MSVPLVPILDVPAELAPLRADLDAAIARVLDSGQLILGPEVEAFEREAAEYLGARHAVGLNSGTDALVIALRALGLGPGDEVITSPFSFFATSEAIQLVGAVPVFVDLAEGAFTLDPDAVAAALTPRTAALLPVHLYGDAAPLAALLALAEQHGLRVIEDAAQAFGARYPTRCVGCRCDGGQSGTLAGRRLGTIGDVGAVSFYPTKNLGALGDAGMLVTDDADLAAFARRLRNHGSERRYEHETLGYNSRLGAIQAAALRVKLPHLDAWTRERRRLAARYDDALADLRDLTPPAASDAHVYHQYTLRIANGRRAEVAAGLAERGIATSVHYPNTLERYGGRVHGALARAHAAAASVLSLPLYPHLGEARQGQVIDALREVLGD